MGKLSLFFLNWRITAFQCRVIVSAVQQSESALSIHMSPPSWTSLAPPPSHPCRSSQSTELSSLCYTADPHWRSVCFNEETLPPFSAGPGASQIRFTREGIHSDSSPLQGGKVKLCVLKNWLLPSLEGSGSREKCLTCCLWSLFRRVVEVVPTEPLKASLRKRKERKREGGRKKGRKEKRKRKTFLVAQWLRLCFSCRGQGFDPWSGN